MNFDNIIKVTTEPTGLVGFSLFLVFLVLSNSKLKEKNAWVFPVFLALSVISLVGGLALAWNEQNIVYKHDKIESSTEGEASPIIIDSKGSISVEVNKDK